MGSDVAKYLVTNVEVFPRFKPCAYFVADVTVSFAINAEVFARQRLRPYLGAEVAESLPAKLEVFARFGPRAYFVADVAVSLATNVEVFSRFRPIFFC